MWEGIGLLLIYLVSGYLNKRKKDRITSDNLEQKKESTQKSVEDSGFDELLLNLFSDKNNSSKLESDISENGELDSETIIKDLNNIEEIEDKAPIKEEKLFEEHVYHSKLADRKEQQLGNKWNKKEDLKKKFFKSPGRDRG